MKKNELLNYSTSEKKNPGVYNPEVLSYQENNYPLETCSLILTVLGVISRE